MPWTRSKRLKKPIDLLLLDGAKQLDLPVFNLLQNHLHPGSIVFADNIVKPETMPLVNLLKENTDQYGTSILFEGRSLVAYVK